MIYMESQETLSYTIRTSDTFSQKEKCLNYFLYAVFDNTSVILQQGDFLK